MGAGLIDDPAEEFFGKFEELAKEAKAAGCEVLFVIRYNDRLDELENVLHFQSGGMSVGIGLAEYALERQRLRLKQYMKDQDNPE